MSSRPVARVRALLVTVALAAAATAVVVPATGARAVPARAGTAPAAAPTPPALVWKKCAGSLGSTYGAQCSMVTVPLDYDDPSDGTIELAISRIAHTTTTSKGVVLVNEGGSGLFLSVLGGYVPNGVGNDYDWIGYDPRGLGSSVPALSCDPSFYGYDRPDYVATTPALQKIWLDREAGYSQDCARHNDLRLLNNMTTEDNAYDLDLIRLALGQKKISYYGFSYGTYLGQVYATLFPTHLARAVFDSNVDPRHVWYADNLAFDVAFTKTTHAFFAWVASHDDVYGLGSDEAQVEALYYGELDQLRRHPQDHGRIGPDEWTDAFEAAGSYQSSWPYVADNFEAAMKHGDFTGVFGALGGPTAYDDNYQAAYNATECTDAPSPTSYTKTWKPDAVRTAKANPFITWSDVWYTASCLTWPAAPHTPVSVDGSTAPPILLVDEQYDAVTPFAGDLVVRSLFPSSSLIEVDGGTSNSDTLYGNACTDDRIADYLASGTLPARVSGTTADVHCAALPKPVPTEQAPAAQSSSPAGAFTRSSLTTRP